MLTLTTVARRCSVRHQVSCSRHVRVRTRCPSGVTIWIIRKRICFSAWLRSLNLQCLLYLAKACYVCMSSRTRGHHVAAPPHQHLADA